MKNDGHAKNYVGNSDNILINNYYGSNCKINNDFNKGNNERTKKMKELTNIVMQAAEEELNRANEKFDDRFNSTHEGYAVIKEEFEEALKEINLLEEGLKNMWACVKANECYSPYAKSIYSHHRSLLKINEAAINLAAEAIQVAAMCQKYDVSMRTKR